MKGENMEHYIQIIIMLAPGFIAKEVSRWLGHVQLKNTTMEQALGYFLYSVFTMAPTLWVLYLYGYNIEYLPVNINSAIVYTIVSLFSGCLVGAIWVLYVKNIIQRLVDWVTLKRFGYEYVQEKTLIDSNLMDGQDHFIEVIRDGKRIALGKFEGIAFKDDENYILKVNSHPVYDEWLEDTRWEEHFQHKCMYIDATHNIEIVEYYFPDGFFSKSFDIKKLPTSMERE